MADTQVIGMNKRDAADDDNDNENLMITVGKLGHWSSREKVIDKTEKVPRIKRKTILKYNKRT